MSKTDIFIFCRNARDWSNYTYKDLDLVVEGRFCSADKKIMKVCIKEWDKIFPLSFFECRHKIKQLSKSNYKSLPNVKKIIDLDIKEFLKSPESGQYIFMDDDDIISPALPKLLLEQLNPNLYVHWWPTKMTGSRWSVCTLGKFVPQKPGNVISMVGDGAGSYNSKYVEVTESAKAKTLFKIDKKSKKQKKLDDSQVLETMKPLTFLNFQPLGTTCFKRFYFPGNRRNWAGWAADWSLEKAYKFCVERYLENSKNELSKINKKNWYVPYWQELVKLFESLL